MADRELELQALEVLEQIAALLMEEAQEIVITVTPRVATERRQRLSLLERTAGDLTVISRACEILVRRVNEAQAENDIDGAMIG